MPASNDEPPSPLRQWINSLFADIAKGFTDNMGLYIGTTLAWAMLTMLGLSPHKAAEQKPATSNITTNAIAPAKPARRGPDYRPYSKCLEQNKVTIKKANDRLTEARSKYQECLDDNRKRLFPLEPATETCKYLEARVARAVVETEFAEKAACPQPK